MAEETTGQERTESATPKRREKARMEGNIARSTEVGSVVVLSVGLLALAVLGTQMTILVSGLFREHFLGIAQFELTPDSALLVAKQLAVTLAKVVLPFAGLVALAGIAANLAQTGILFTLKPLAPKPSRISPATGIKRIISKRSAVEFVKSLIKLTIVGAVIAWSLVDASQTMIALISMNLFAGYGVILGAVLKMAAAGAFALGLLAILDFFFQRYDHEQQIKMTRQEVKEESKQSEGDPLIKGKVRAKQQEMSRQRMMEDVKTADVVVTNPIRFAVALKYDPEGTGAPRVVAKGARLMAKRIRDLAKEAGIPIVQDPPLARALFRGCKVGAEVPVTLYKAVAELLAFVYRDRDRESFGGAR